MSRIKGTIMLKDREIPLKFTCLELRDIQLEIATPFRKAISIVLGRDPEHKGDPNKIGGSDHLTAVAKLIRILGNAGLEESGQEPDLTDKMILRKMTPSELADAVNICIDIINEGMGIVPAEDQPEESEPAPTTTEK